MLPEPLYEKDLFRRIARDDESAFRMIFDHYKERFYATALKMTRSDDAAREIVQDVFVTLWLRRSALPAVENPRAYLFTIVHNQLSARFRKLALEKSRKEKISEHLAGQLSAPESTSAGLESRQILRHLISGLPPRQQHIWQLSRLEGLSRNEIAERLHISPNTVRNHLLKAMKYIRIHFRKALLLLTGFFV